MLCFRLHAYCFLAGLSLEEVREYEKTMQEKTNTKIKSNQNNAGEIAAPNLHSIEIPLRDYPAACESNASKDREVEKRGLLREADENKSSCKT